MREPAPQPADEELAELFRRCCNWGRWGPDDELGTLNYIDPAARVAAARLVRSGRAVSLGADLSTEPSAKNPRPVQHLMLYENHNGGSALDYVGVAPHGYAVTHLDAVAHVYWQDHVYGGRNAADVCTPRGLGFGSVYAQRDGIITRGVLLDVAAARGTRWLEPDEFVTPADLDAAERHARTRLRRGDAIFVHVGLEAREAAHGPEDVSRRAGLHAGCLPWLHEREVAVYSGDCVERVPYPSAAMPVPLHQIGLAAMGLVLLDCPRMAGLVEACRAEERHEFLLSVAPLRIPAGTGSPVNPLALF